MARKPDRRSLTETTVRLATTLSASDSLVSLVLKGHLLIEEQLYTLLCNTVRDQRSLEEGNLRFSHLFTFAKSLYFTRDGGWLWEAVARLNSLRNALAHNLEPPQLTQKIEAFLAVVEESPIYPRAARTDRDDRLCNAIAFTHGVLRGLRAGREGRFD